MKIDLDGHIWWGHKGQGQKPGTCLCVRVLPWYYPPLPCLVVTVIIVPFTASSQIWGSSSFTLQKYLPESFMLIFDNTRLKQAREPFMLNVWHFIISVLLGWCFIQEYDRRWAPATQQVIFTISPSVTSRSGEWVMLKSHLSKQKDKEVDKCKMNW